MWSGVARCAGHWNGPGVENAEPILEICFKLCIKRDILQDKLKAALLNLSRSGTEIMSLDMQVHLSLLVSS